MSKMSKKNYRLKRARKTRARIGKYDSVCLSVHRTAQHIYVQIIVKKDGASTTLASVSTLDKAVRAQLTGTKTEQARIVGTTIAERALEKGIKGIPFDRSGFKYHGRVKALAEAARESGLIN